MKFTFQKFSDPNWGFFRSFDQSYVPDEIFTPVLDTLKSKSNSILKFCGDINRESRAATINQKRNWNTTLETVIDLWNTLDLRYGDRVKASLRSDTHKITDVTAGRGGGRCDKNTIAFERDGTLNDPVYMAHESGHLMSFLMASDQNDPISPPNIAEIQAFFMQEHAYDRLLVNTAETEEKHAIGLHRLADYTDCLSRIPFCLWLIDKKKGDDGKPISLQNAFAAWSVDDQNHIDRYKEWLSMDDMPVDYKAQMLHSHPFSVLIAIELHDRFCQADEKARKGMLKAIYENGANTSLPKLLETFGIRTKDDLKQASINATNNLAQSIAQCGFDNASHIPLALLERGG